MYNSIQETEFGRFPPMGQKSRGNRSRQKGISQIIEHATIACIPNLSTKHGNNYWAECSSEKSSKDILHSNALVPLPLLAPNRHGKFKQVIHHS